MENENPHVIHIKIDQMYELQNFFEYISFIDDNRGEDIHVIGYEQKVKLADGEVYLFRVSR